MKALFYWTGAIVWACWLGGFCLAVTYHWWGRRCAHKEIQKMLRRRPYRWHMEHSPVSEATVEELTR